MGARVVIGYATFHNSNIRISKSERHYELTFREKGNWDEEETQKEGKRGTRRRRKTGKREGGGGGERGVGVLGEARQVGRRERVRRKGDGKKRRLSFCRREKRSRRRREMGENKEKEQRTGQRE